MIVEPGDTIPTGADDELVKRLEADGKIDDADDDRARKPKAKGELDATPRDRNSDRRRRRRRRRPCSTRGRRFSPASPSAARPRRRSRSPRCPSTKRTTAARSGGSLLYDAVASFFAEGGGTLYVARAAGAGAVAATGQLGGAAGLHREAASPGVWGNTVKVTAVAPAFGTGVEIVGRGPGRRRGRPLARAEH